ncbi:hypothetical protein [Halobellus ordinarius]|nr:hypothetical protein [Halobellus sp. ZY16]
MARVRDDRFARFAGFPDRRNEWDPSQQREVVRVGEALDSHGSNRAV